MPLIRRIPKRGFTNPNRITFQTVNVRDLERLEGEVTPEVLSGAGLIRSAKRPVKVLGMGTLSKALTGRADAFSASARKKIEDAGGSVGLSGDAGSSAAPAESSEASQES